MRQRGGGRAVHGVGGVQGAHPAGHGGEGGVGVPDGLGDLDELGLPRDGTCVDAADTAAESPGVLYRLAQRQTATLVVGGEAENTGEVVYVDGGVRRGV